MSVEVFLNSQGHLLHNLSSQRERLPLPMAALPYLTTSLFCPHYWFSLLILGMLPHLHTIASTMWQSRYSPWSFRENPEETGVTRYLLMSQYNMKSPEHRFSTDLRSHLKYSAFYSSALFL